jgi:hypothetical protein
MFPKKEVVYPIFIQSSLFSSDAFWKNVFEDLAYCKCPYGTYISKDFFYCKYPSKEFSYKIETKDPKVLYDDVYSLLVNKLGLLSHQDKFRKKADFTSIEEDIKNSRKAWSNIRKKNIKDLLLEQYAIDMRNKYSLSIANTRQLLSLIFLGMSFKIITAKDIVYEDGKVKDIEGIRFSKNKIILDRDIYSSQSDVINIPSFPQDKKSMWETWEKYLENLRKTIF